VVKKILAPPAHLPKWQTDWHMPGLLIAIVCIQCIWCCLQFTKILITYQGNSNQYGTLQTWRDELDVAAAKSFQKHVRWHYPRVLSAPQSLRNTTCSTSIIFILLHRRTTNCLVFGLFWNSFVKFATVKYFFEKSKGVHHPRTKRHLCAKFDVLRPSQSWDIAWRTKSHPVTQLISRFMNLTALHRGLL